MNDLEKKVGGIAMVVLFIGYAIYQSADAVEHFLVVVFIIAVVIAGIVFFFWQRSTKRSAHPWE